MSMRSAQRFIAREQMKEKGYTKINKKHNGDPAKGTYGKKKHAKIGSGSWFAAFWREAFQLKDQRSRDQINKSREALLLKKAAYILKMHKNGRSIEEISRQTGTTEASIRQFLKNPKPA